MKNIFILLIPVIVLLGLGVYFSDKITFGKDYYGNRYVDIRFKNTKPYTNISCYLGAPKGAPFFNNAHLCSVGKVFENATQLRGPEIPTSWKTYINQIYGISIKYPEKGTDATGKQIECGNSIQTEPSTYMPNSTDLFVDSFYGLNIVEWEGSLIDYTNAVYKKNDKTISIKDRYLLDVSPNTDADEAYMLIATDKPFGDADPFGETTALYKKGRYVFNLYKLQSPRQGCVSPDAWDKAASLHFIP